MAHAGGVEVDDELGCLGSLETTPMGTTKRRRGADSAMTTEQLSGYRTGPQISSKNWCRCIGYRYRRARCIQNLRAKPTGDIWH
jgi:hypothetical protein